MTNALKQAQLGSAYANAYINNWRSKLINADMRIDQRNNGAAVSTTNGAPVTMFPVDRFKIYSEATSGTITGQRLSGDGPTGFPYYLRVKATATGSIAPNGPLYLTQIIEGYNISDLGFGSAGASSVALSFWYRSSISGTHSGALKNSDGLRTYPFSFTVNTANTWEFKTIIISGDTTGTWATDNTAGMYVVINIGSGSSKVGTAGSWTSSQVWGVTGAASLIGTLNATIDITGIQLEAGVVATPFEKRPYSTELLLGQRYYRPFPQLRFVTYSQAGQGVYYSIGIPDMRTTPTVTQPTWTQANCSGSSASSPNAYSLLVTAVATAIGTVDFSSSGGSLNSEL